MPKRKLSADVTCPGCQSEFDSEVLDPVVGSSDHSLCGACLNKKELETCPEGEAKKSKMGVDEAEKSPPIDPVPAILDPMNRTFLVQIVNMLDPKSFVNLARACSEMHDFCFNSDAIKIVYNIYHLDFRASEGSLEFKLANNSDEHWRNLLDAYKPTVYVGDDFGFLGSLENRKKLRKYPFAFVLERIHVDVNYDSAMIAEIRSFLAEFPIKKISYISSANAIIIDWERFMQFVKDFHVEAVAVDFMAHHRGGATDIREDAAAHLLHNIKAFLTGLSVPDRLILNASVPTLELMGTSISKNMFIDLLMRFAHSTEDIDWNIASEIFEFGHYDLFKSLPFDYSGPLPDERPLVFSTVVDSDDDEESRRFWILRKDGKLLLCYDNEDEVVLTTKGFIYDRPPCLSS